MAKSSRSSRARPLPPMGLGECLIGAAELRNVTQVVRNQTLFRYYGVGNAPHPNSFASRAWSGPVRRCTG